MKVNPAALIAIRESQGMSQNQLAHRADVDQSHISKIEAGKKNPAPATLKKLAEALAVPLAAIAQADEAA